MPLYKYREKFHEVIWSQEAIGWRQIFNGRISRHWLEHQGNTKILSGKVWMDYIWGASIIEICLQIMIELWNIRNEEVHSKDEATKQQKRKAKAAIIIPALHDLQEQARLSDSFLFSPDIEEEIEHATAAKLEGFIAMRTRPIHNSASTCAERVTSQVKLIVELIKIGGKNNRAVLERLEKRY